MNKQAKKIFSGLVFLMMAVALAMVLLCTRPSALLPPFIFILVSILKPRLRQNAGYLNLVRSVCKIE